MDSNESGEEPAYQIKVDNLYKVFGRNPRRALAAEHVHKSRDEIQSELNLVMALRNVSFEVRSGETFVVMGLSGSGKSTLVRCLIRLIEKTSGNIFIDSDDVTEFSANDLREFRRSKIAMVFQQYGLLPHRNVLDNAAYGLEVKGMEKEERYTIARRVLELVGLTGWENSKVRQLSGGMQQRVGLARALAVEAEILLMDEPFSGLDPLIRRQMRKELASLQKELKKTIVFITHDLDEAITVGDRIAIMRDGEIIQLGTPREIIMNPVDDFVREFTEDITPSRVIEVGSIASPPPLTSRISETPDHVLKSMINAGVDYSICLDEEDRFLGMLRRNDLDRSQDIGNAKISDMFSIPSVHLVQSTTVEDAIPSISEVDTDIPVTNDDNRLLGVLTKSAVIQALGRPALAL